MKCPFYRETVREAVKSLSLTGVAYGPTPPHILVGEWGYPRVFAGGGLVVSQDIDLGLLESPKEWLNVGLNEILAMRLGIALGRVRLSISDARRPNRFLSALQESSLSVRPLDIEVKSSGSVRFVPGFGIRTAPHGPSFSARSITVVDNPAIPRQVDSVVSDPYVPAGEAVERLAGAGLDEYFLTRLLSAGLLGRRIDRRLVPTEWSITAVDDMLAKQIYRSVKSYGVINEYRLHSYGAHYNYAYVLLTPTPWIFELLEGWIKTRQVYSDHEYLAPRREYADNTGGAYYAVRLSVLRHLRWRREQSGAIVFFEVDRGWIPLGVWRFREVTRAALESEPLKLQSLGEALEIMGKRLKIGVAEYLRSSKVTQHLLKQEAVM